VERIIEIFLQTSIAEMNICALPNIENSVVVDGFCAFELPVIVNKPRSLRVDTVSNNIFVLERASQSIINIFDSDGDGIPDTKKDVRFC